MDPALADVNAPRLRVATYNVHRCVGTDRRRSETRIAEVIASLDADVVGLQEVDANRARSGRINQAQLIAEQLRWNFLFQPAMGNAEEQYGIAILSRYPLRLDRAVHLPGRGAWYCRETRVALSAEVESELGALRVINTHFGLARAERLEQAESLHGFTADLPTVLLGDFNSLPRGGPHRSLTSAWRDIGSHRTFPTLLPLAAVDHIFVNAELQPIDLRVHRSSVARVASDHYPLVADLARVAGKTVVA